MIWRWNLLKSAVGLENQQVGITPVVPKNEGSQYDFKLLEKNQPQELPDADLQGQPLPAIIPDEPFVQENTTRKNNKLTNDASQDKHSEQLGQILKTVSDKFQDDPDVAIGASRVLVNSMGVNSKWINWLSSGEGYKLLDPRYQSGAKTKNWIYWDLKNSNPGESVYLNELQRIVLDDKNSEIVKNLFLSSSGETSQKGRLPGNTRADGTDAMNDLGRREVSDTGIPQVVRDGFANIANSIVQNADFMAGIRETWFSDKTTSASPEEQGKIVSESILNVLGSENEQKTEEDEPSFKWEKFVCLNPGKFFPPGKRISQEKILELIHSNPEETGFGPQLFIDKLQKLAAAGDLDLLDFFATEGETVMGQKIIMNAANFKSDFNAMVSESIRAGTMARQSLLKSMLVKEDNITAGHHYFFTKHKIKMYQDKLKALEKDIRENPQTIYTDKKGTQWRPYIDKTDPTAYVIMVKPVGAKVKGKSPEKLTIEFFTENELENKSKMKTVEWVPSAIKEMTLRNYKLLKRKTRGGDDPYPLTGGENGAEKATLDYIEANHPPQNDRKAILAFDRFKGYREWLKNSVNKKMAESGKSVEDIINFLTAKDSSLGKVNIGDKSALSRNPAKWLNCLLQGKRGYVVDASLDKNEIENHAGDVPEGELANFLTAEDLQEYKSWPAKKKIINFIYSDTDMNRLALAMGLQNGANAKGKVMPNAHKEFFAPPGEFSPYYIDDRTTINDTKVKLAYSNMMPGLIHKKRLAAANGVTTFPSSNTWYGLLSMIKIHPNYFNYDPSKPNPGDSAWGKHMQDLSGGKITDKALPTEGADIYEKDTPGGFHSPQGKPGVSKKDEHGNPIKNEKGDLVFEPGKEPVRPGQKLTDFTQTRYKPVKDSSGNAVMENGKPKYEAEYFEPDPFELASELKIPGYEGASNKSAPVYNSLTNDNSSPEEKAVALSELNKVKEELNKINLVPAKMKNLIKNKKSQPKLDGTGQKWKPSKDLNVPGVPNIMKHQGLDLNGRIFIQSMNELDRLSELKKSMSKFASTVTIDDRMDYIVNKAMYLLSA